MTPSSHPGLPGPPAPRTGLHGSPAPLADSTGVRSRRTVVAVVASLSVALLGPVLASCASDQEAAPVVELSAEGERGKEVVSDFGCTSCHSVDGEDGIGPTWAGLAGSEVLLGDGTTVVADEEYLRTAIVDPSAQIVDGYRGIMPERSFDDDEVDAMVAYLQDLGGP